MVIFKTKEKRKKKKDKIEDRSCHSGFCIAKYRAEGSPMGESQIVKKKIKSEKIKS